MPEPTALPLTARQQMAMARPWDHAEPDSLWEITGRKANGTEFIRCLAMVVPPVITGSDDVVFVYIHPGLTLATSDLPGQLIPAANVTHARPLLLVHRGEPGTAYYEHDQDWLDNANGGDES